MTTPLRLRFHSVHTLDIMHVSHSDIMLLDSTRCGIKKNADATLKSILNYQKIKMALSEFEEALVNKVVGDYVEKRRPKKDIRDQVDLSYRIENQSVIIYEIRSAFNDPESKIEPPIAKATFVKKGKVWKIYWQRQDLKWHLYEPEPFVCSIEEFINVIDEDQYGAFWG